MNGGGCLYGGSGDVGTMTQCDSCGKLGRPLVDGGRCLNGGGFLDAECSKGDGFPYAACLGTKKGAGIEDRGRRQHRHSLPMLTDEIVFI